MITQDLYPIYLCATHGELRRNEIHETLAINFDLPVTTCNYCEAEVRPRIDVDEEGNEVPVFSPIKFGVGNLEFKFKDSGCYYVKWFFKI